MTGKLMACEAFVIYDSVKIYLLSTVDCGGDHARRIIEGRSVRKRKESKCEI